MGGDIGFLEGIGTSFTQQNKLVMFQNNLVCHLQTLWKNWLAIRDFIHLWI